MEAITYTCKTCNATLSQGDVFPCWGKRPSEECGLRRDILAGREPVAPVGSVVTRAVDIFDRPYVAMEDRAQTAELVDLAALDAADEAERRRKAVADACAAATLAAVGVSAPAEQEPNWPGAVDEADDVYLTGSASGDVYLASSPSGATLRQPMPISDAEMAERVAEIAKTFTTQQVTTTCVGDTSLAERLAHLVQLNIAAMGVGSLGMGAKPAEGTATAAYDNSHAAAVARSLEQHRAERHAEWMRLANRWLDKEQG